MILTSKNTLKYKSNDYEMYEYGHLEKFPFSGKLALKGQVKKRIKTPDDCYIKIC